MYRIGHRKFRLCTKKNAERKRSSQKSFPLPVSIPLSDAVSVLRVSLPIELLSFGVSIPIEAFLDSLMKTPRTLRSRVTAVNAVPPGL